MDIGITKKDREKIAEGLSRLLADSFTLYLKTHNFHWNVTGPMFNTLHAMFMAQYTELWNAVDPIAERIRSLGHVAPGSYAQFAKLSSLKDAPATPPKALEMVRILVQGHEAVARTARRAHEAFPSTDEDSVHRETASRRRLSDHGRHPERWTSGARSPLREGAFARKRVSTARQ